MARQDHERHRLSSLPTSTSTSTSSGTHRAQLQLRFPTAGPWLAAGGFERAALWPLPTEARSFAKSEWTAYYRAAGERSEPREAPEASDDTAFLQIFVCRGELTLTNAAVPVDSHSPQSAVHTLRASTFFSGVLLLAQLAAAPRSADCLLLVKRTGAIPQRPELRFRIRTDYEFLPNLGSDGILDAYGSAYVVGNPLKAGPGSTAIVRFPAGSIVSSHYHAAPIFHEFIYLAGGHLTPDGFYAPGDHITSSCGGKEGPWLACQAPDSAHYPADWPRYASAEALFPQDLAPPFANPWGSTLGDDIIGLLFVHGGPFVLPSGELNWQKLTPQEPGRRG